MSKVLLHIWRDRRQITAHCRLSPDCDPSLTRHFLPISPSSPPFYSLSLALAAILFQLADSHQIKRLCISIRLAFGAHATHILTSVVALINALWFGAYALASDAHQRSRKGMQRLMMRSSRAVCTICIGDNFTRSDWHKHAQRQERLQKCEH